jgi:hypothetical protein
MHWVGLRSFTILIGSASVNGNPPKAGHVVPRIISQLAPRLLVVVGHCRACPGNLDTDGSAVPDDRMTGTSPIMTPLEPRDKPGHDV